MRCGRAHPSCRAAVLAAAVAGALLAALGGGCTNAPFDPDSVPNEKPVARIFVGSLTGDTLNATSYYHRTFRWSGSDADGRIVAFYVTIETERGVSAPWDTTTRTDTTMTFTTDDNGHAEATVRVVCRDDRGALSDTVSQYIPLRNFPPVVNFTADYDTVRWSYGAANFRCFAFDLDGSETMDDSLLYRLDCADSTVTRIYGEPGADPALCWVKKPFDDPQARTFTIALRGAPAATRRTLTVSVTDEARAETRFRWTWKVLPVRGTVLMVADSAPLSYESTYKPIMDGIFGETGWSLYNVGAPLVSRPERLEHPELYYIGLPDGAGVLLDTFRQFSTVLWYTGGPSQNLRNAINALTSYVVPVTVPPAPPPPQGRLLLISKALIGAGSNNLVPPGFVSNVLGLSTVAAPPSEFQIPIGLQALGQRVTLPPFASVNGLNRSGLGVQIRSGTEALYKLQNYHYNDRPPYEPVVCTRKPTQAQAPLATVIVMSLQLESFDRTQAAAALRALLSTEMGVAIP